MPERKGPLRKDNINIDLKGIYEGADMIQLTYELD
jgi:hypothetical protein